MGVNLGPDNVLFIHGFEKLIRKVANEYDMLILVL